MDENSQVNSGRIDLSRFSAMTEGKWEIIDTPTGGIDVGVRHGANAHSPVISFTQRLADMVRKSPRDMADLEAIAMLPELIKPLAKMYAFEDELAYRWHVAHGHDCGWCNDAEEDIADLCKSDYRCFLREHFASDTSP